KLPPYWFRFVPNQAGKDRTPGQAELFGWWKVYRGSPARVLQTIAIRCNRCPGPQDLRVRDANFDGYNDLYFVVDGGAKSGTFEFWLFNPVTGRFANTPLARELGNLSPNDQAFDAQAKVIRTDHFFGACEP